MTGSLYLRLKSLNTRTVRGITSPKNIVRVAAMHNLREIQAELGASAASGIHPARMHLNYQLRGPATADEVAGLAVALLDNAGVKALRRDACMALELVISLPAGTAIDHREYFAAAVTWADAYFNVPILSAAVHLDEAAPHLHVLLLPLVAGRMQGGALAGGPAKIRAMLADFQQQVAQRFGLTHQPRTKRLSKPNRDAAGRVVLDALRARPERLIEPGMRDALIAAFGSQAETLLPLLGLSMPTTKATAKSFVQIMTAPCKPERARRAAPNAKHIDVAQTLGNASGQEFDNVYVSVDVAPARDISLPTSQPTISDQTANASTTGDQLCAITGELSAAAGAASVHVFGEQQSAVELASGLSLGTTTAGEDSRLRGNQRTTGQQASARLAVQQATGGQQRERSTTGAAVQEPSQHGSNSTAGDALSSEDNPAAHALGTVGAPVLDAGQRQASTGVQNILHTPFVASTKPVADQEQQAERLGKNTETFSLPTAGTVTSTGAPPRKRATKPPVAAAGRPEAKRAAGTAQSVDHGEQRDQVPGQQKAGQHPGAPVQGSVQTPENSLRGDAGQAVAAAMPARAATRGQNGPDPLPIVPSAPASSRTGKSRRTAAKVASAARTAATTAPHQPASTDVPENFGARPPSPATSSADQVGQAVTARKRNAKTAGAKVATTTAAKPAGPRRSAGGVQSLQPMVPDACSTAAKPARSKRATKGAQKLHPLSPDASTTAAKRRPASSSSAAPADEVATCAPLRVSSSVDGTDAAAPEPSSTSKATAGTAASARRERVAAVKPGKSRNKSHVPGDEELSTTSSHDLGESPNAQDVDQPDEIRRLGAGVGPLSPSSEKRTKPAPMPAQAPPIGGPWDGAGLPDLGGDPQPDDEVGDYQRHRDDDHAAEHWDEQRGEFIEAATRHGPARGFWPPHDAFPAYWREATPGAIDAALWSILALRAAGRTVHMDYAEGLE